MKLDEIENGIKSALMERIKVRSCYLSSATGNILEFQNKKYIVTCRHVADDFFHHSNQYVLLRNNQKIKQNELKYISRTNKSIDIALIEILDATYINDYYTQEDFQILNDFSNVDSDKPNFFVFGYPEQLKYEENNKEIILWMSYLTIQSSTIPSNHDFLYLDYPRESDNNIINEKGIKTILPKAPGLSGAFIFKIDTYQGKKTDIWLPSLAKIIGIQSAWNEKDWLKGCNIKYLFNLLDEVSAI